MRLMLSQGTILTSCYINMSYLGGELLMELMLLQGSILTSCYVLFGWYVLFG